jgi:hypothetical protein
MPLDPRIWARPPQYREFPEEVADIYQAEETPLCDVLELWEWKWDLAQPPTMFGASTPNERKRAERLGKEVEDFLAIEEDSRAAIESAERELEEHRKSEDTT